MTLNTIFIIGPQGSGKGTQARILAERLGFFHWDMGSILRRESDFRLSTGETVGEIVDRGIYLSDEQLLEVARPHLEKISTDQGIIFDGIPRRMGQGKFLMDFLHEQGRTQLVTLYLTLPKEESLKRLLLRAEKEKREDDSKEKIERRLRQFEEETKPILEYLRKHSTFIEIDGRPPIEEVTQNINAALGLA